MSIPVHVTFRRLMPRPDIEAEILERASQLQTYFDRIVDCRVVVELPNRRHDAGNHFRVRIELTVPQERLVIAHEADLHAALQDVGEARTTKSTEGAAPHKYLHEAIHEAFEAARRRLQDYVRRQRDAARVPAAGRG